MNKITLEALCKTLHPEYHWEIIEHKTHCEIVAMNMEGYYAYNILSKLVKDDFKIIVRINRIARSLSEVKHRLHKV